MLSQPWAFLLFRLLITDSIESRVKGIEDIEADVSVIRGGSELSNSKGRHWSAK